MRNKTRFSTIKQKLKDVQDAQNKVENVPSSPTMVARDSPVVTKLRDLKPFLQTEGKQLRKIIKERDAQIEILQQDIVKVEKETVKAMHAKEIVTKFYLAELIQVREELSKCKKELKAERLKNTKDKQKKHSSPSKITTHAQEL